MTKAEMRRHVGQSILSSSFSSFDNIHILYVYIYTSERIIQIAELLLLFNF